MFFYPSKDRVEGVFVWTSPFLLIFIFRGTLGTEWGIVGGDVVFSSASSSRNLFSSFSCAFSIFLLACASLDSMYRHCGLLFSSHCLFSLIICVSFVVPFLCYKIYRWNVTERFAPHIKRPYSAKVNRGVERCENISTEDKRGVLSEGSGGGKLGVESSGDLFNLS